MGLFTKMVSYEEINQVAVDKVHKVAYHGESITRIGLLQYIYSYFSKRRGEVDLHTAMDIVERMYVNGEIRS